MCYVFFSPSIIALFYFVPFFFPLRLFLKSHSGTAGRQSSMVIHGADFSTKDMDNDNCMCKCALMLTGGKYQGVPIMHHTALWKYIVHQATNDFTMEEVKQRLS